MTHNIIMPDLGQTVVEGKILRWLKRPGEHVSRGESLLEVETDKVTMEVECYRPGFLRAILIREGEMATAMSPIALLTDQVDEAVGTPSGPDSMATTGGLEKAVGLAQDHGKPAGGDADRPRPGLGRVAATPAAKLRARELHIDLRVLAATRRDGLITRRDVDRAQRPRVSARPAHPMAAITARSVQSIPQFYVTIEVDVGSALAWRQQWNLEHLDSRLSLNDVFVRVAALALRDVPTLNVRYSQGMVEQRTSADVLLVVAAEGGLTWTPLPDPAVAMWPEHADRMRQAVIGAQQGAMAKALPEGAPALAISNLGMFGVKQFTALIPPDSAAILAIGAVRQEPVVRDSAVAIADRCTLTLGADHRVVEGVTAAKFLERIQFHLNSL
jgi:pyruvate dehydrogenase E2 component (dihydrolipoamide acetyltransferase)